MACSTSTSSPEAPLPLGPANLSAEVPTAVGAAPESARSAPLSLPASQDSSSLDDSSGLPACGPAEVPESELPACADIIYRPWFSPYSYLISTKEATQQSPSSLSSSWAATTTPHQEQEELDDLSETVCSSSSSGKAQPPEGERLAGSRSSITIQDILTASRQQPLPQQGYKCVSCCRVFPMLWSVKSHIQNSAQEGYSCKVYYRRLKALWEKEQREQEAAACPGASL